MMFEMLYPSPNQMRLFYVVMLSAIHEFDYNSQYKSSRTYYSLLFRVMFYPDARENRSSIGGNFLTFEKLVSVCSESASKRQIVNGFLH